MPANLQMARTELIAKLNRLIKLHRDPDALVEPTLRINYEDMLVSLVKYLEAEQAQDVR